MADLLPELRDYAKYLDEAMPPVEELATQYSTKTAPRQLRVRPRRGWAVAAVTGAAVLVVIGGFALGARLLLRSEQTPAMTETPAETATWTTYGVESGLAGACVFDLAVATDGSIWALTTEGISMFTAEAWTRVEPPVPFYSADCLALSMTAADDGSVWFTGGGPAYRYLDGAWSIFPPPREGGEAMPMEDIAVTRNGTVWGAAGDALFTLADQEFVQVFAGDIGLSVTPSVAPDAWIQADRGSLYVAPDGALWIAGGYEGPDAPVRGTIRYDGTASTFYPNIGGVLGVADDGTVWFDGPVRFDGRIYVAYPINDTVGVAFEEDGTVWIASHESVDEVGELLGHQPNETPGAYRFDGEQWTRFTTEDGLSSNDLTAVVVGPDGSVWFGTQAQGVTRLQPGAGQTTEGGTPVTWDSAGVIITPTPDQSTTTTVPPPPPSADSPDS